MTFEEALDTLEGLGWYISETNGYVTISNYDVWSSYACTADLTVNGLIEALEDELGYDGDTYLEEESHAQYDDSGNLNIAAMKCDYWAHVELLQESIEALSR